MITYGSYTCETCTREWDSELPPLWTGLDLWPVCCGVQAFLIDLLDNPAPELVAQVEGEGGD